MTSAQQRDHARHGLEAAQTSFGRGPKWCFAVDSATARYVAYLDCDLANNQVPAGEANISYSSHPLHRDQGQVSRGVRLVVAFLRDNTGAREGHLVIDERNAPSLRVAHAVGGIETERFIDDHGNRMIRYVVPIR